MRGASARIKCRSWEGSNSHCEEWEASGLTTRPRGLDIVESSVPPALERREVGGRGDVGRLPLRPRLPGKGLVLHGEVENTLLTRI